MARPNNDPTYLNALRDYYAENRVLPSYAKIARLLGFRSKNAALSLVKRLEDCGFLRRTGDNRIAPMEAFFARPMATEKVAAGQPTAVSDAAVEQVLIRKPSRTVLVSVKGDPMKNAGIFERDVAVLATGYLGESDLSLRASREGLDGALWHAWDETQRSNETEHLRLNAESTMGEHPDLRVHRLSQHEILARLFAANEARRGPGYNRRLLRSLGRCLHAVLAAAAGSAGAPVSLSLRGLAKATGISFRSARIARDRLVAWEVLIDEAGGYRIGYSPLHDILYNAVLPAPNPRSPSAKRTA
ncbi:MAG: LexA family protein [Gammaproteobacteria bacterium]